MSYEPELFVRAIPRSRKAGRARKRRTPAAGVWNHRSFGVAARSFRTRSRLIPQNATSAAAARARSLSSLMRTRVSFGKADPKSVGVDGQFDQIAIVVTGT